MYMKKILMSDIDKCLNLLKNFLYTERNYSLNRNGIAAELSSGEHKIKKDILESLINFQENKDYWDTQIDKIDFFSCPKKITPPQSDNVFINTTHDEDITIDEVNLFINFPVSIGVVNTLFIYLFGELFEKEISPDCLGNRLNVREDGGFKKRGFTLYKSYFEQYKKWRTGSITLSKSLHDQGNDVLLINLDFKRFFYSIDLDFSIIYEMTETNPSGDDIYSRIVQLTEKTHTRYREKVKSPALSLPIGLPSSGVLANWVLKDFDRECRKHQGVSSYSRYVDDIIMVVANPRVDEENPTFTLNNFIPTHGKPRNIKTAKSGSQKLFKIKPDDSIKDSKIFVNNTKVRWFYFKKESPISLIEKFIQDTSELSSEWKLLSDHSNLDKDLLSELYQDSLRNGDIKSVKDLLPNKSNLALFFEKSIISALYGEKHRDQNKVKDYHVLSDFYQGKMILDCISFWDRTFTLLTCLKDYSLFSKLANRFNRHISNVSIDLKEDILELKFLKDISIKKVRGDLVNILRDVIAYSTSINPTFIKNVELSNGIDSNEIFKNSTNIRQAGFTKRHHTLLPILSTLSSINRNPNIDLTSFDFIKTLKEIPTIKQGILQPFHFVRYTEIKLLYDLTKLAKENSHAEVGDDPKILFNNINGFDYIPEFEEIKPLLKAVNGSNGNSGGHVQVHGIAFPEPKSRTKRSLKIGLASIEIRKEEVIKYVSTRRHDIATNFDQLSKILRLAYDENVDLLVFPENSICLELIPLLLSESLKTGIGMAFGLKHIIDNEDVFNIAGTILPDRKKMFGTSVCYFRHKNHFAPEEVSKFGGVNSPSGLPLKCYKGSDLYYHFRWLGISFTLFNCFELADISHRAAFRGIIDLLVAIEFNSDVPYFSNLIESSVRDLHCVAAQCNSSVYGDSRVTTPVKKEYEKDLVKIKGGSNCYVVVCEFDFYPLTEFQKLNYPGQRSAGGFKPTPPGFETRSTYKRNSSEQE